MDTMESTALLREIAEQQRRQIALQTEALALQREHIAQVQAQLERAERINAGAEAIQRRAAQGVRVILWMALPVVVLLLLLMLWPHVAYWVFGEAA